MRAVREGHLMDLVQSLLGPTTPQMVVSSCLGSIVTIVTIVIKVAKLIRVTMMRKMVEKRRVNFSSSKKQNEYKIVTHLISSKTLLNVKKQCCQHIFLGPKLL